LRAGTGAPPSQPLPRVQGSIIAIEAAISTRAPLTALDSFPPAPVNVSISVTIHPAVSSPPSKDLVVAINVPVTIDSSVSRPGIDDFIITILSIATIAKYIDV
jgi:hypothetical protein